MKIADRYEPTGNAKWGGMGEVHECNDLHLNRKVMMKRVKRSSDANRLVDEYKSLLKIRSKHVVELLDIVKFDYLGSEEAGLIIEYIDGSPLYEGMYQYGADYLRAIWQICSGLTEIHEAGIIHRDIKPDNILFDSLQVVKILDFGLAREFGKDDRTKSIIGTPGFMAPELFSDKTISFTYAVDMYAFGLTAFSLLRPLSEVNECILLDEVDNLFNALDRQLGGTIRQCLHNNPSERPRAQDVRDQISRKLTYNTHRAKIINGNDVSEINANSPASTIKTPVGSIKIHYDGDRFYCHEVEGSVTINNRAVRSGDAISSNCLIMFGSYGSSGRAFLPFNVSIPEVVI